MRRLINVRSSSTLRRKTLVGKEAGTADLDISEQVLLGQPFQVVLEQSLDLRLVQLQKKLQQRPPAAVTERAVTTGRGWDRWTNSRWSRGIISQQRDHKRAFGLA